MPSYQLSYFPARGRAELTRLLFIQAGVKFEDVRIAFDEFKELKAGGKLPFGQLPTLETDGMVLSQSGAIARFVADQVGLAPSTAAEQAQADMIIEGVKDLHEKLAKIRWEQDEEKKKEMKKEMFEKTLPTQLGYFEKLLKSNNDGKGYFFGDKLTYADLGVFDLWNSTLAKGKPEVPEELKANSLLREHYKRVMAEPSVLEWIKTRGDAPF